MKAKLSKEGSFGYKIKFYNDDDMAACALGLLSLKNCQAIENGYNLDELAKEDADLRFGRKGEEEQWLARCSGVIWGFQKALELIGDKKFSEEQVLNAFYAGWISKDKLYPEAQKSYKGYLKRHVTQQTEWDVEIEMDILNEYDKPKLDADGCLILKLK